MVSHSQVHPQYFDFVHGSILGAGLHHANPVEHPDALAHAAEDGVLAIQPLGWRQRQEELAPVRVRARIGHGQNSCTFSKIKTRTVIYASPFIQMSSLVRSRHLTSQVKPNPRVCSCQCISLLPHLISQVDELINEIT